MLHIATIDNLLETRLLLFKHFGTTPNMSYNQMQISKSDTKWLERINEIVIDNFINEFFSVDTLAKEMAVSRSKFQRKLKVLTSMTPNEYIRVLRLKKAGELLGSGVYRINEVCDIVGFNNHSYFARCFHKQFGILPNEFMKK